MAPECTTRQVPVAVVGAGAFMPGSTDLEGFWRNVLTGRDLMTEVPQDRWRVDDFYDPDPRAADKTYGRRGAFLSRVGFDPVSFGIPPNSLPAIDTSQLLALMVAERVLGDCAVGLPEKRDRVSVMLGVSSLQLLVEASARLHRPVWLKALRAHGVAEPQAQSICDSIAASYVPWQEETFPGLLTNVVSGRIANRFDLHGTNHTTDAACASSLAALYSAIAELSLHQSDLVITGGVDTMNDVLMYTCFSKTPALSPSDDCRPFSAAADGTMLGEGVVMFALKRLSDAQRDGDRVYAVIRGVGTSSDGRGTAIYAPLPDGQMRALRRAYERAGYGPETVELVEAHGTGTVAGDAAEFAALRQVFDERRRTDRQWCALGSIKSQIGHTKAAAGASGLLKAVLALHHKVLPPTIKVDEPNPALDLESSPFYLNTQARPWIQPDSGQDAQPRRAAVSSFGFGGTNFHLTLEEYLPAAGKPASPAWRLPSAPTELILISAPAPAALLGLARQLDLGLPLADLARQTQHDFARAAPARLAVVARDADDLAAKLAAAAPLIEAGQDFSAPGQVHFSAGPPAPGLVGFLFPGQGAQYVGMGGDLAIHLPTARTAWDRAATLGLGEVPLHRVVFPPPAFTDAERVSQEAHLTATEWAQPAIAVHSLALLSVLRSLGLAPDCVAGHSFGELVALHAAGAFDAQTLIRLARARGELMRDASAVAGSMLAVTAGRDQVEATIADLSDVWLANHNAPSQVVLAGTIAALDAAAARLTEQGIATIGLNTAAGFHSPLVAPAADPLLHVLQALDVRAPALDAYAGRDAGVYPADPDEVRRGLASQIAAPVRFVDVIEAMYSRGVRTFAEVGPSAALTGLVTQILGDRQHVAVCLDRKGRHAVTTLQEALGRLAVQGHAIDFAALWPGCAPAKAGRRADHRKTEIAIDGGNYGRPYPPAEAVDTPSAPRTPPAQDAPPASRAPTAQDAPPASQAPTVHREPAPGPTAGNGSRPAGQPAPAPPTGPATVIPAVPVNGDQGWLRVIEEAQSQAAQAHAEFQRAITESHLTFLQMAEATFAGLLGAATGQAPEVRLDRAALVPDPPAFASPSAVTGQAASHPDEPAITAPEPLARAEPMDAESIGQMLLSVVAERTGYPVEMINVDMELDTDLGIDSIKKVEILSVLRERVGDVPGGDLAALATLRTLRAIAERVGKQGAASAAPPAPAAPPADGTLTRPAGNTVTRPVGNADNPPADDAPVARWAVRAVTAPPSGLAMLGLTEGTLAVTGDGTGIAPLVVAELGRRGIRAEVVRQAPPDGCGLIVLDGLRQVGSVGEALDIQRDVFRMARSVARRMQDEGGIFVTVQDTGGDFGLASYLAGARAAAVGPSRAWLGGLAALAKTAAREWPRASVKAIDCAMAQRSPAEVAAAIVAELTGGGAAVAVGLRADGTRITTELTAAPVGPASPSIGPQSVIVATGGARGMTAAALRLLAARHQPRLALLGRTRLDAEPEGLSAATSERELIGLLASRQAGPPAEIAAMARRILAVREIRATLAAIEQAGAPVRYYALDVRDPAAVQEALCEVRSDWGPVTGIVHGAGVLADALLAHKTDEQFADVFNTKVEGLGALLTATAHDPLELLCVFSSAAGQFGNQGQSDYAMANEVLNQVLSAEQAGRPGCLVRAIGWGPWRGGMVTQDLAERFVAAGVQLIEPGIGARAFLAELGQPAGDVRVIVSAADRADQVMSDDLPAAQVTVSESDHGYLADHQIGGVPVVPVSTVLDWFAGAARAWRPTAAAVVLRELRVLDKISLPRLADAGHRLVLRARRAGCENGQALDLDLRDAADVPHYRASAAAGSPPVPGTWAAPADLAPLKWSYDGTTLFHGPRFQAIRAKPSVCPAGAQSTVAGARALGWGEAAWHVDPAAVDGGLQLAVLWAQEAGTGRTLPMAIRECRVYRFGAVEEEVRCVVLAMRAGESTATCDIALIDPDGAPRVELLGVELVRRPS